MDHDLEERVKNLEDQLARRQAGVPARRLRKRARSTLFGLPVYDVAIGPDLEKGESRGHARGIIAIGDMATGVVALGGLARGLVAIGGLAVGLVSGGGAAVGLGVALGGFALGSLAFGGGAVGVVAVGGGAAGYYAVGGGAAGRYVMSPTRQDPEADELCRILGLPVQRPGMTPASPDPTSRPSPPAR